MHNEPRAAEPTVAFLGTGITVGVDRQVGPSHWAARSARDGFKCARTHVNSEVAVARSARGGKAEGWR